MSNIRTAVDQLTTHSAIDAAYALLKERTTLIDRNAAGNFRLNQSVKFRSSNDGILEGYIESIGRTGRVKVKLNSNSRYDSYSMGAAFLNENLR